MTPSDAGGAALSATGASVGWSGRSVVAGVSFTLARGGWLGIVGPNGSGKTTLLRALLGLSRPLAGSIDRGRDWRAGYVRQSAALDPLFRFRAHDIVAMAARADTWLPFSRVGERRRAADDALRAVGAADLSARIWSDLSGGQRQRVLLARALASDPNVLVLDEPTNGLDVRAEEEFLAIVRDLRAARGLTVILVTHALHLVADDATEVGLLAGGAAVFGPADEILTAQRLTAIYGCPVSVRSVDGLRVLRAERRRPA